MSEKSFGVKQLNILGSSGTPPQIESSENLRIRVGIGSTVIIGDSDTDFNSPSPSFVDPNNTAVLNVGVVTANNYYGGDYYGTFKGDIDPGVPITNAKNIEITDDTSRSDLHYIHFGSATSGYDGVEVDSGGVSGSEVSGLVYQDGKLGVGTVYPKGRFSVYGNKETNERFGIAQTTGTDYYPWDDNGDPIAGQYQISDVVLNGGAGIAEATQVKGVLNMGASYLQSSSFAAGSGSYKALKLYLYKDKNIDNAYGLGMSDGMLEIQSSATIGFFAGSAGTDTGERVERLRITSSGDVGIGTNDPVGIHSLTNNEATLASGYVFANYLYGTFKGDIDTGVSITNAKNIEITDDTTGSGTHYIHFGSATSGYDGVEIDSTGLVYKDSKLGLGSNDPSCKLTIATDNTANPIEATRYHEGVDGPVLFLQHSRSNTIGTKVALNDNDEVGGIEFRSYASDNSTIVRTSRIFAEADGTPDTADVPAALVFATNDKSGAGTAQERLRITSGGDIQVDGGNVHIDNNGELAIFEDDTDLAFTDSAKLCFDFSGNVARIRSSLNGEAAARPLAFYIGTDERLEIGTTGTVKITKGSGDGLILKPADDTDTFQINFNKVEDDSTSGAISYDFSAESLKLKSGGTDRLTLDSGGNLLPDAGSTDGTDGYTLGGTGNYWKAVYAKTFIGANLDANATTASKLQNSRNIAMTDDVTWSVDFDGSDDVTNSATLATVNSNTGSFGSSTKVGKFTVNGKGLITAAEDVTIDISGLTSQGADSVKITANSSTDEVKYLWMGDDSTVNNYDALEVDLLGLVYDNGNLAIGAGSAGAESEKYRLYVHGGTLGEGAGDVSKVAAFTTLHPAPNADRLQIRNIRNQAGNDWYGARHRIQRMVDVTPMGYIDFGSGVNNDGPAGRDIIFGHAYYDNEEDAWKYKDGIIIKKHPTSNKVDLIPGHDSSDENDVNGQDLGSASAHFRELFVKKIVGVTVDGSINEANKLSSTHTFQISGNDATATAQDFDGTQNVDLSLVLAESGVTAATYGDSTNVGQFTVDAKGRITTAQDVAIDISGLNAATAGSLDPGAAINLTTGAYISDDEYSGVDFAGTGTTKFTGSSDYIVSGALNTTGVSAGDYGSATEVPTISVDTKGRITNVVNTSISIDISGDKSGTAGSLDPGAAINLTTGNYLNEDDEYSGIDFATTGTTKFTGSSAYTVPGALNATGVTANTYGTSTVVPKITVDSKGRITNVLPISINFPTVGTVDNAKKLLTGACAGDDETNYPIPFATDDSAGGENVYKGYHISNINNLFFNCKKQQLYSPKMKGTLADFTTVKSGLLETFAGDKGAQGQVPVSGGQTVDEEGNTIYTTWTWEDASSVGGVTNVTVSQTGRDDDVTEPITVSTPETNTKQIDISNTSNAYGRRWVQDTSPDIWNAAVGDIWYDTSDSGDNPVISFVKNMVIMWYGRIDAIPTGWQLCNGSNGSPNLINKFVIGAGVETQVKPQSDIEDTNGNSSLSGGYRDAIVVSHWHGGVTHAIGGDGDHSHDGGGHEHNYSKLSNFWSQGGDASNRSAPITATSVATSGSGDHSHDGGAHVHGIDSDGVVGTYRNLPPWFALCYIMKL